MDRRRPIKDGKDVEEGRWKEDEEEEEWDEAEEEEGDDDASRPDQST